MAAIRTRRKNSQGIRFHVNWPLWLGILFVGTIVYLAVTGPSFAPRDPMEENLIVKDSVTGKWHVPPFSAFTVTGFPLGSDEFGRDIYSRLLFAVRPTLQMVLLVAGVRLVLGTLIGLIAGYSTGKLGSFFDSLISSALSIPGLLVALGAIAIVGVELGVLAFVIGLSLTGWAETARLVREQTRTVRQEVYVEAAFAMGATDTQIVYRHVLRQIRSMLLMLLAFEVGSTLMLTAGLGFLGYYIGGDVWVDVADFVARRTSGTPELGQMLATAWVRLTDPWGLVSVGSVVFMAVLGFNLVGEGLRLRLSPEIQVIRIRWVSEAWGRLKLNIEQAWYPIGHALFSTRLAMTLWTILAGSVFGYWLVTNWQAGTFALPGAQVNMFFDDTPAATATPTGAASTGGATPTSEQGGSQTISAEPVGESSSAGAGGGFAMPETAVPLTDPVITWTIEDAGGFAGRPSVGADGSVYVAGLSGSLSAVDVTGDLLWQQSLDPAPAFSPTLAPDGTLYVSDRAGGVSAFSTDGTLLWQFRQPEEGFSAVSQVTLAPDGTLYYTVSRGTFGLVQALAPDGTPLWLTQAATTKFFRDPVMSASGEFVFLAENIFDSATGSPVNLETVVQPDTFFTGDNGKDYFLSGNTVFEWQRTGDTLEVLNTIRPSGITDQFGSVIYPLVVYVTADETFVFVFRGVILWENAAGELLHEANTQNGHALTTPISIDEDLSVLVCGQYRYSLQDPLNEACYRFSTSSEDALWKIDFGAFPGIQDTVEGAARTTAGFVFVSRPGMVYSVMERGLAEALEEQKAQSALEGATITATGSGWIFNTPTRLLVDPLLHEDGTVYLLTDENKVFVLDDHGAVRTVLELPEPIFVLEDTFFGGTARTPFPPILLPDGGVVAASSTRLYALGLDGALLWEVPLDAEPHSPPTTGVDSGLYYLLDKQGSLYAFTPAEGLQWKHDLEEGLRPAFFFPVFSSTGDVFYSITNGTRGQIEALAPDGTQRWRTTLSTFNFYRPIQITPAGDWISLNDNAVRTDTGELVELAETDFPIDQFAMGRDGKTYLLSGSTIMEWTLLSGGRLNIVRQVTIAFPPNATRGLPPQLSVTEDGTIWIVFVQAGGRTLIFDWIDFDGNVLNQFTVDQADEFIIQRDFQEVSADICSIDRAEMRLVCRRRDARSPEPLWEITIQGIPRADNVQYFNGTLYIQTSETSLQTVKVDFPTE